MSERETLLALDRESAAQAIQASAGTINCLVCKGRGPHCGASCERHKRARASLAASDGDNHG